jgi:uncharacterized protein YndB with AHSA1/START domain
MSNGFEHTTTIDLPAPPARVFRALTDADELRAWFATAAAVEARPGGGYHFWGTATLGAPDAGDQRITALEPDRALAFSWTLQGVPTEVAYRLTGDGATTRLEVRHAIRGALPYRRPDHVVADLWRIHGGNLGEHLRASGGVVLPDFTSGHPEVRATIEIAAPPARVWRALTEPALMNQWLGGAAKVDLPGGALSYGWSYEIEGRQVAGGPTRIIELVEHRRLVTDWPDWRGDPDKPSTRVTWELEPLAGGARTRVTVIHTGFEHPVDRSDYQQGWAGFLEMLGGVAGQEQS